MPFIDTVRSIPYAPRTRQASGFLPPLLRAKGHILHLAASIADPNIPVTDDEAVAEIRAALEHWNARIATNTVSTATRERAETLGRAMGEAIEEFPNWNDRNKLQNIRDLGNRFIAYCCDLDRELVGITDSDPGSSL